MQRDQQVPRSEAEEEWSVRDTEWVLHLLPGRRRCRMQLGSQVFLSLSPSFLLALG
jgi:hypothetical protein